MKTFYEDPRQVVFKSDVHADWRGGIAFHDYIICGCCGNYFFIKDIQFNGGEIKDLYWVNISEEIGGDKLIKDDENEKEDS